MAGLPEFFQGSGTTVLDELADFELGGDLEDEGIGGLEEANDEENDLTFGDDGENIGEALPDFFRTPNNTSDLSITGVQADVFFSLEANKKSTDDVLSSLSSLGLSSQTSTVASVAPSAVSAPLGGSSTSATSLLSSALGLRLGQQATTAAVPADIPPLTAAAAAAEKKPAPQNQFMHGPPPGAFAPPRGPPQFGPGPFGPGMGPPMPPHMLPPNQLPPPHMLPPHMLPPRMPPPPPHFGMGPPPMPPMGQGGFGHHPQQLPPQPRLPHGSMMNSSDVKFVVMKSMQSLITNDPYSDDYYFIQAKYKQSVVKREDAIKAGEPLPPPMIMPFPAWRETKERIVAQLRENKQRYEEKSREWEEKEQVLGHLQRSDVSRPKEQLSIPSWQDLDDADGENGEGMLRVPFASRLWNMRQAVQRGYQALYTVQELNHLLQAPMVAGNPVFRGEVMAEIDAAVNVLSQSLGIRPSPEMTHSDRPPEISLEGGLVAAILQTPKGKKLMSRSINLLMPEQRWALIPVIMARVLQADPTDQPAEDQAVEQKLLKILLQFIHHSHQFQQDQQALAAPHGNIAPFTLTLLHHLRQCVKSVMVSQMEKSRLRSALLSSRSRAEVMHVVVEIGDKVANSADETSSTEWVALREAFMSMLDG